MGTQTYEITVSGRLGPVVRSALARLRVRTDRPTYVVQLVTADADSVWDLLQTLTERGYEPSLLRVSPSTTRHG